MGQPATRQRHAQYFREAAHGIGRPQHRTGSDARKCSLLRLQQFIHIHFAGLGLPDQLPHIGEGNRIRVLYPPRQHWSPRYQNGGDVQAHRGHQHARHDLVAARQHNHGIKLMRLDHVLNGVRNHFSAGQRITHPLMSLTNSITDGNGRKFPGNAPRLCNAQLHKFCQLAQMIVTGHHLGKGIYHRHHGLFQILGIQAGAVQQSSVGRALNPIGELSAATVFKMHLIFYMAHRGSSLLLLFQQKSNVKLCQAPLPAGQNIPATSAQTVHRQADPPETT